MSDNDKTDSTEFENPGSSLKHQITCNKCGMVYEISYLVYHSAFVASDYMQQMRNGIRDKISFRVLPYG